MFCLRRCGTRASEYSSKGAVMDHVSSFARQKMTGILCNLRYGRKVVLAVSKKRERFQYEML